MKKYYIFLFFFSVQIYAQSNLPVSAGQTEKQNIVINNKGSALFSTLSGIDPPAFAAVSTRFTDAGLGGAMTVGADDFTVPNCGWEIGTIAVNGNYSNQIDPMNTGPASSVNVYLLNNSGALPDTTNLSAGAIWVGENLPYTELDIVDGGDFEIALPSLVLSEGSYWLVMQANMELLSVGQWIWTESSLTPNSGTTNGNESAWFQSQNLVDPGACIGAWGARVTTCGITRNPDTNPPADLDLAFEFSGTALTSGVTLSESILTTSEDGLTESYDVNLNAPPTSSATVTVTPQSNDATEGSVSGALSFTSANWDVPQQVTITPGASGDGNDGDVLYQITHSVATTNPTGCYSALTNGGSINVTNQNIEGVPVELQSFEIE